MNNRTIKSITAATMVLAFGGLAAFAQPRPNEEKNQKVERREEKARPEVNFDKVSGKINISGKNGNQLITITTKDKKTYVLTTMQPPKEKKDDSEKTPEADRQDREHKGPFEKISAEDLIALKGKQVTLYGFLNSQTNVFVAVNKEKGITDFSNVK